jgi:hypothetical protein
MATDEDTRSRLLRVVWNEIRSLSPERVGNYPAAARAVASGASPDDLSTAMAAAKYELAFRLLFLLTAEHAEEGDYGQSLGWTLLEGELQADGSIIPTESLDLDFLHESLLTADPTGREGQDLFA